jgi:hypothetical protein
LIWQRPYKYSLEKYREIKTDRNVRCLINTREPLKNVGGKALARRICHKKRSLQVVNEHFFGKFNAARESKVIFQMFPSSPIKKLAKQS